MVSLENLLIIAIIMIGVAIAIELGLILKPRKKITEHVTAKGISPRLILPEVGELTIIGGKRIGDKTFPVTEEFGKEVIIPTPLEPFKNVFPTNPEKLLFGDPAGMTWVHIDEDSPMFTPLITKLRQYEERIAELTMRNAYLEEENRKINERFSDVLRQRADEIGELKKKLFTIIPKGGSNPPSVQE